MMRQGEEWRLPPGPPPCRPPDPSHSRCSCRRWPPLRQPLIWLLQQSRKESTFGTNSRRAPLRPDHSGDAHSTRVGRGREPVCRGHTRLAPDGDSVEPRHRRIAPGRSTGEWAIKKGGTRRWPIRPTTYIEVVAPGVITTRRFGSKTHQAGQASLPEEESKWPRPPRRCGLATRPLTRRS